MVGLKSPVLNEKGQIVRRCPKCSSTRLRRAIDNGFECLRCHFLHKRRYSENPKDAGKVSFVTY